MMIITRETKDYRDKMVEEVWKEWRFAIFVSYNLKDHQHVKHYPIH